MLTTTPRRVIASLFLIATAALALGPSPAAAQAPEPPHVFENMAFLDAKKKAEEEKKILYVNGVVATCQDCLKMDLDVFRNPRVVAWLAENAVCIKIDADAEPGESLRLKLGPYPTHIFLRENELVDRMEGYLSPSEFLSLAKGAERGRTTGERIEEEWRRALRNGFEGNAKVRYEFAQKLLDAKRYDAATEEFVFLWSNVVAIDPRYAKTRHDLAGMAGKIKDLISKHPPARDAFTKLRDELTPKVDPNLGVANISPRDVNDWVALNNMLRDWPTLIAWTDDITANHDNAILEMAGEPLFEALRPRSQWRLMGLIYDDPMVYVEERRRDYADQLGNPTYDSYFIDKIADMYAACLAADRIQDAQRVAAYAIAFKDIPNTRTRLSDRAEIAGIPEDRREVWPSRNDGPSADQGPPAP